MSFVLEALKKQEADRDPDAAVSLARAAVQQRRHRLWMALFAVAMAVNVALLWWVLDPLGTPARQDSVVERPADREAGWERSADRESAATTAGTAPSAASPTAAAPVAVVSDAGKESRSQPDSRSGDRSHPEPDSRSANRPHNIALADLPADARERFPGIAFSTHIYAEDPQMRAVVANGERHEEGDRIRGLEIVEITERGVVLAFEGDRVEVPMVVDWDSL